MAEPGQGAQVAAQSLFSASAAVNAIPVAGQFASVGLAIAGLFTKIFGGRRKKKREEERQGQQARKASASTAIKATASQAGSGGVGVGGQQPVGATAPVSGPASPSFSSFGGGSAPSVQPTQQVLNNSIGIK